MVDTPNSGENFAVEFKEKIQQGSKYSEMNVMLCLIGVIETKVIMNNNSRFMEFI